MFSSLTGDEFGSELDLHPLFPRETQIYFFHNELVSCVFSTQIYITSHQGFSECIVWMSINLTNYWNDWLQSYGKKCELSWYHAESFGVYLGHVNKRQESRRAYGTAVSSIVFILN